jgi:arabinose-5-phosphate isomerase
MSPNLLSLTAEKVMTKKPRTIRAGALAAEAVGIMNNAKSPITCLFVTPDEKDGGATARPIGIIHIHDCLRAGVA